MVLLSGAVLLGILEALGSIPGPKREKKQRKVSLLFMLHKNTAIGSLTPASPLLSLALGLIPSPFPSPFSPRGHGWPLFLYSLPLSAFL